jgi:hypothetical protein
MPLDKLDLLIELSHQRLDAITNINLHAFTKEDLILSMKDYIKLVIPFLDELRKIKTFEDAGAIQAQRLDARSDLQG